jgi:carbon dioxide concentrating mechanism protein CcmN
MYHTPLQPLAQRSNTFAGSDSIYASGVNGEVSVHPSAAIAPGVLLQADPGCAITVGAGVCIGMGAIIHAFLNAQDDEIQDGKLEISAGANLGAGVLILGNSKLRENCCIGSNSTVLHSTVGQGMVLPPNSVLADKFAKLESSTLESSETFDKTSGKTSALNNAVNVTSPEVVVNVALEPPEPSAAVTAAKSHLQKFMGKIY